MSDEQARQLADLEVKRNRTLADLEAIQAAVASVRKSMDAYPTQQEDITQQYVARLDVDGLLDSERIQIYHAWNEALKESASNYNDLADEREQLHVQELILVRMVAELDARIRALKELF
jgi:hypothetical protein